MCSSSNPNRYVYVNTSPHTPPDLKSWSLVGTDARLRGNIHGICVFEHEGTTQIAVAQNDDARVLVIALDGVVKQELNMPKGGEFNFDEANLYDSGVSI